MVQNTFIHYFKVFFFFLFFLKDGGIWKRKCQFGVAVKYNFIFFPQLNLFDYIITQVCKNTIFN